MFLRQKDGKYAGEIREFPSEVARALLDAGRAENPYADPARPAVAAPVAATISSRKGKKAAK